MALKVAFCVLCVFLASVLCDESCSKLSESFLSKLGMEIAVLEKGFVELSAFTKDVVWNTMQTEMRLRQMKMEMETFRQSSLSATGTEKVSEPVTSSTAATATSSTSASAVAQASAAAVSSNEVSSNTPLASSTCNLQQLLKDQFKGNVLIEIKAAPATENTTPTVQEQTAKTGELSSCANATKTGIYRLKLSANVSMDVLCDTEFDKGGWVVIQHRFNGSEEFYRNWTDYENGFGSLNEEFWLGNEKIFLLTAEKPREIAFVMEDPEGNKKFAQYASFKLGDKTEKYMLKSLGTFSGSAGDSLSRNVGSKFSTHDMDNDRFSGHCAQLNLGAWWYDSCHQSNLNGKYMKGNFSAKSMCWNSFQGSSLSLKTSRIMVRF
ncbi:ficolin-1-like [Anopheles maculipalpis]|uniref:ficolin-1-like n=1 Tax=Anopheles maculipalpis TaxID=1496333 RepID=UPI002159B2C1|nr:ficolin-1-like [Anopheles maculipalpis]